MGEASDEGQPGLAAIGNGLQGDSMEHCCRCSQGGWVPM